jgi:hypothetical protein
MDENLDASEIAREFPGWEAWQGINRLWHARIRGATPPVMVHGEDLVDLRDQIVGYQYRTKAGLEQPVVPADQEQQPTTPAENSRS